MNIRKLLWAVLAGFLTVAAVLVGRVFMSSGQEAPQIVPVGRSVGHPAAVIKVVEYTDFQCPGCAKASGVMHKEILRNAGRIFLELKYFPLPMHKNARRAAVMAECALAQGKFWLMEKVLFSSQKSWADLVNPDDYLLSLARGIGCDDLKMMRCMSDHTVVERIDKDIVEGKSRGVAATPTFFINGQMVVGAKALEKVIAERLK